MTPALCSANGSGETLDTGNECPAMIKPVSSRHSAEGYRPVDTLTPLPPHPCHKVHKLVGIRQHNLAHLCGGSNPSPHRTEFACCVLLRVPRLVNVGPGRLDSSGRVDRVLAVGGIGERGIPVLFYSFLRISVTPAMNLLGHGEKWVGPWGPRKPIAIR